MKKRNIIFSIFMVVMVFFMIILLLNTPLKSLEKEVDKIVLPEYIEKIAIKSAIGDSGGNGDYTTRRVVLLVKSQLTIDELKQEFKNMNLKFPNHYKSIKNKPIFYITHCESNVFKSSRDFSLTFDELAPIEDHTNYYFIEFVE